MHTIEEPAADRFPNRVLRHSTELVVLLIAAWIGFRLFTAEAAGRSMAERERRAIEVMRSLHGAQQAAIAGSEGRLMWLSELIDRAPAENVLRKLVRVDQVPEAGIQVFESRDYYFAVYLVDPELDDTRAFAPEAARSPDVGKRGYGAFAWPSHYGDGSQWAFNVDHRGRLLGTWNHKAIFDGFEPPFPPVANPLKDYNQAVRDGSDSEWFLFDDLGEIAER